MLTGYFVCVLVMFMAWAACGVRLKSRGLPITWPRMWIICIIAGMLWPLALAWIVFYNTVSSK